MAKRKIFVAIPTTGTVVDGQTYVLRRLERRYGGVIEFIYPESCTRRVFHDFARNALVQQFLESDAEAIWFLDSDITPPDNILDLVHLHWDEWQAAGAPYPIFMTNNQAEVGMISFAVYEEHGAGLKYRQMIPPAGQEFVAGLATGCMFLKRGVFEKLELPYFEFKFNPSDRFIIEGEDLGFCLKLNKLGIKFFTDFGMVCKHEKKVCLLDMNNYAIQYANNSVMTYDAQIKEQVTQAIKDAYKSGLEKGQRQSRIIRSLKI